MNYTELTHNLQALKLLVDNPNSHVPQWNEVKGEPTHVERNMHKRLPGNTATNKIHNGKGDDFFLAAIL